MCAVAVSRCVAGGDTEAPEVADISVSRAVGIDDTIEVCARVTDNSAGDVAVVVTVGSIDLPSSTLAASGLRCSSAAAVSFDEGEYIVTITATDESGNVVRVPAGAVVVDLTAPTVDAVVAPGLARPGGIVTLTLVANEVLRGRAQVIATGAAAFSLDVQVDGDRAAVTLSIPDDAISGALILTVTGASDLAGNPAPAATATLTIDATAPTMALLDATTRLSHVPGFDTLFATVAADDAVSVVVTLGDDSAPCVAGDDGGGALNQYFCAVSAQGVPEGSAVAVVVAEDAAGNEARLLLPVEVDLTAPTFVAAQVILPPHPVHPRTTRLGPGSAATVIAAVSEAQATLTAEVAPGTMTCEPECGAVRSCTYAVGAIAEEVPATLTARAEHDGDRGRIGSTCGTIGGGACAAPAGRGVPVFGACAAGPAEDDVAAGSGVMAY